VGRSLLAIAVGLLAAGIACDGAGNVGLVIANDMGPPPPSIVGNWRNPTIAQGPTESWDVTFAVTGSPTMGSVSVLFVDTNQPPPDGNGCLDTLAWTGSYAATSTSITSTAARGTREVHGCKIPDENFPSTSIAAGTLPSVAMAFSGPIAVTDTQLTLKGSNGTLVLMRQ
jgi:hypothetical protein